MKYLPRAMNYIPLFTSPHDLATVGFSLVAMLFFVGVMVVIFFNTQNAQELEANQRLDSSSDDDFWEDDDDDFFPKPEEDPLNIHHNSTDPLNLHDPLNIHHNPADPLNLHDPWQNHDGIYMDSDPFNDDDFGVH